MEVLSWEMGLSISHEAVVSKGDSTRAREPTAKFTQVPGYWLGASLPHYMDFSAQLPENSHNMAPASPRASDPTLERAGESATAPLSSLVLKIYTFTSTLI